MAASASRVSRVSRVLMRGPVAPFAEARGGVESARLYAVVDGQSAAAGGPAESLVGGGWVRGERVEPRADRGVLGLAACRRASPLPVVAAGAAVPVGGALRSRGAGGGWRACAGGVTHPAASGGVCALPPGGGGAGRPAPSWPCEARA